MSARYSNALLIQNRFFECNYGTSGTPFDKIFGTFRDKLKETGTSYRGGSEEKVDDKTAAIHDAKASLAGTYIILICSTHSYFSRLKPKRKSRVLSNFAFRIARDS